MITFIEEKTRPQPVMLAELAPGVYFYPEQDKNRFLGLYEKTNVTTEDGTECIYYGLDRSRPLIKKLMPSLRVYVVKGVEVEIIVRIPCGNPSLLSS